MVWRWDGIGASAERVGSWGPEVGVVRLGAPRLAPGLAVLLEEGSAVCVARRVERQGPLERWDEVFREPLEVPPWRSRELAKLLAPGGRVPVRPLRSERDLVRFLTDIGLGEPHVSRSRQRTAVAAPGVIARHTLGPDADPARLSLEGEDPEAIARVARALAEPA